LPVQVVLLFSQLLRMRKTIAQEHTPACSCQAAADGMTLQIESSKSTRYSCGNNIQGLRAIGSSLGDPFI